MWKVGLGGKLLLVVLGLLILIYAVDRQLLDGKLVRRIGLMRRSAVIFTSGDFPPGAAAPATDGARVPIRPLKIATIPRGSTATLLMVAGGTGQHKDAPITRAFGVELDLSLLGDEQAVIDALAAGGDRPGGVDAAVMGVDRFVQLRTVLPDAKLKTVLLVSRSRGHEAIAVAPGINQMVALKDRPVAVPHQSSGRLLLLWELAQIPLSPLTIKLVPARTSADAARLLKESRVDAAVGTTADLAGPARERGGKILATSADVPQLLAMVMVVRSDFLARYPDAVRRLVRAVVDSVESINRDPSEAARLLAVNAPQLGDPFEALKIDPPASLAENLAFFEIRGDTPVRYDELFNTSVTIWRKLGENADTGLSANSRELGPLISAGTPGAKAGALAPP